MTTSMQAFARWIVAAAALALAAAGPAPAQENAGAKYDKLTGTLKKVHDTRRLTIGYREASFPFSYLNPVRQPIGYSIDLCSEIYNEIVAELEEEVNVAFVPVTPENRIAKVVSGEVDLECGSTTRNREREKQVAFSPTIFVSGTKLLVRRGGGIRSWQDLRGKTVVVTRGTTNEQAMKSLQQKQKVDLTLITGADHEESFKLFDAGKADTFALDDVLLYGFIERTKTGKKYFVAGDFISYDPYAIMFRKDDPHLQDVVERTFARLAASRELVVFYDSWFRRKLASGEDLNLTMSPQLEEIFQVLGLPE